MITGNSLLTFLRQASKVYSDKQSCTDLLEADIYDFPRAVCLLFDAFIIQMVNIGLLPPEQTANAKCNSLSELKNQSRSVFRKLRIGNFRLFTKSEYNFGICFLFLYYFQRILDIVLPKDISRLSDDNDDEDNIPVPLRMTQEEVVMLLTGSKDRTHVHDTVGIVCADLAAIMNRQLKQDSPRFQRILEKITKIQGNRSIIFLRGLKGSGKSDFLIYLDKTGLNVRYYPQEALSSFSEVRSWVKSCVQSDEKKTENETMIILENIQTLSFSEILTLMEYLEQYNGKERISVICTSRTDMPQSFYSLVPGGFTVRNIEMPLMDIPDIEELLGHEHISLDPRVIKDATFGYPPLVVYCSAHMTEVIPFSIYFKTLIRLFEIRTPEENIRLLFFISMIKDGMISTNSLNVPGGREKSHLFHWDLMIRKAAANGLLAETSKPGIWLVNPVISFLSDKIIHNKM